jgi:putative toxin-antitoxin system antitoxin component (TIGR02293 family)
MKKYKIPEDENSLPQNIVFEPAVAYLSSPEPSAHNFIEQSRNGVSKRRAAALAESINLSVSDLCYVLHISERTWQRYSLADKLAVELSEKVILLENLSQFGAVVLESKITFGKWLKSEIQALNFKTPLSFLDTAFGFQLVSSLLGRIEHGVYS